MNECLHTCMCSVSVKFVFNKIFVYQLHPLCPSKVPLKTVSAKINGVTSLAATVLPASLPTLEAKFSKNFFRAF